MGRLLLTLALVSILQAAGGDTSATLDFVLASGDGAPSLTPADLSLKIGGREQRIQSVDMVTVSNEAPRYVVLIVDEATLYSLEPVAKDAIGRMLKALGPRDRVEYFSTRLNGMRVEPTTKHERIAAAAEAMVTGPGVLWTCQRDMIELIRSFVADAPRGRTTSINVIARGHPEGASPGGDSSGAPCTPRRDDMRRLEEALSLAQINLHLFTVDENQRSWGFDTIAGNTGGTSALLTWSSRNAIERAIKSTATFYRITYTWDDPTDRPQRVELKSIDKSLKIRTSTVARGK